MVFFKKYWLTITIYDVIFLSMMFLECSIIDENLSFIYSGLNSISGKGRERLKNIAQSLIAMQNRLGTPIPDNISHEIMKDSTMEIQK